MNKLTLRIGASALLLCAATGSWSQSVEKTACGVCVTLPRGAAAHKVSLQVVGKNIVRVHATPEEDFADAGSLIVVPQTAAPAPFTLHRGATSLTLQTAALKATVDLSSGLVSFGDLGGRTYLAEDAEGKQFTPVTVDGTRGYSVRDVFRTSPGEALYGLGQHQADEFNYRGRNEELFQYNTKVSVPMIVSTRNYGILWDAYCMLRFGNPRPYSQLNHLFRLLDKDGREGALTGTYVPDARSGKATCVRREDSLCFENLETVKNLPMKEIPLQGAHVTYEGSLVAPATGRYHFILYYAGYMRLFAGGREVVAQRWRTAWNPNSYKFTIDMKAGQPLPLRLEWQPDGGESYCGLRAMAPVPDEEQNKMSFWGEMQNDLDYYLIAGRSMDEVVRGYRTLTGRAPIMPRWAMGYWQSRDKYNTQDEVLRTFGEYRRRQIPIDNIVQDWSYWKEDSWGSQEFEASRYPDPKAMMDSIHAMNGHLMISVWPKFYPTTANFKELDDRGFIYRQALRDSIRDWIWPGYLGSFYDPYSKEARTIFWNQMNRGLYSKGIDAWWMDASEPDIQSNSTIEYRKKLCGPTAMGPSTKYFNTYALMNAQAIYEGQRSVNPNTRVFLLTRSGFAGLQRYSTATWSGDIGSRWEDMKAQISAGLNYALSGIPYWTMDIGGYCTEERYAEGQRVFDKTGVENADLREWRELNTRWHQFGSFAPLYRSHGKFPLREIWNIAPQGHPAYESIVYYDRLRYRLMPYTYTLAGMTHFDDYTIMRALAMDFEGDTAVYNIGDQYMFGPALMVCPVYKYEARSRQVYLPRGTQWYDFYTGRCIGGGQHTTASAPLERMPLYVRAGSIVPMGPDMQYAAQADGSQLTLYVYEGADGRFSLYEDEGTNYNYEHGAYARIPLSYNERTRTLTLGATAGSYSGMPKVRHFTIVAVSAAHPQGFDAKAKGQTVRYDGKEVKVKI